MLEDHESIKKVGNGDIKILHFIGNILQFWTGQYKVLIDALSNVLNPPSLFHLLENVCMWM